MEQTITIKLFGQSYTFKTDCDIFQAEEIAASVVDEVTKVQDEFMKTSATISDLTILMLAVLNIAGQNFEFKKSQTGFLNKISEKAAKISRLLDADS
ncbi:MAG: hypothetical protein BWK80_51630 [Desulfobacteraceae bacterium IS3]|nr:MAG: hypothetical protein BWK80_51630 [Desulfobacteraceae bacterium IS3]